MSIKKVAVTQILAACVMACASIYTTPASAQTACDYSNALIKAGLLDQATKELTTLTRQVQKDLCISDSLARLVEAVEANQGAAARAAQIALADAIAKATSLSGAGEHASALKVLQALPATSVGDELVVKLVEIIKANKATAAFKAVSELDENGFRTEAVAALNQAIAENPGQLVPDNLNHLGGGGFVFWHEARNWLYEFAVPIAEMVAVIAVGLLILFLLWLIAKPLLQFQGFNDKGIKNSPGEDATALMQAAFQGFANGHGQSVTRIGGNLEAIALPGAIQQALPSPLQNPLIQLLPTLFDKVLPRTLFTVTGNLHDSETKGAGLTVIVTSNKQHSETITLWESDFRANKKPRENMKPGEHVDQSGDFEPLADYAAIWLLFRLTAASGRTLPVKLWRQYKLRQLLGTDSWRAYALFRAAYTEDENNDKDNARKLYVDSLRTDTNLPIAKINLARLARDDRKYNSFAIDLWEDCLERGKSRLPFIPYPHEQSHYAALYSLASLTYTDVDSSGSTAVVKKAETKADEAALELAMQLVMSIKRRQIELFLLGILLLPVTVLANWEYRGDLKRYLRRLMPVAKAMLGGLMIATGDKEEGGKMVVKTVSQRYALPKIQYNLACSYSIWAEAEKADNPELKSEYLNRSLDHLTKSHWLSKVVKSVAASDRSLNYLRNQRKYEFDKIFETPMEFVKSPKNPLGGLDSIGLRFGPKLTEKNINSVSELLKATKTLVQRIKIAEELKVGVEQVTEWAQAMELASLRGVELEDLDLLKAAGIQTLNDLKIADATTLRLRLIDWSKTKGVQKVPDESDVELWVQEARRQSPFVQL